MWVGSWCGMVERECEDGGRQDNHDDEIILLSS